MDPQQIALLMQQVQDQAQQIAVLQAQANQPQANVPVAPPAAPVFALTPALANGGFIDLSTTSGIKLQKSIVAPLTNLYDGKAAGLSMFMKDVKHRASRSGWNDNLLKISNQANPPVEYNLITSHRLLSMENIRAHALTYVGQQTRQAQDGFMMYEFLRESLTKSARARIELEANKYTINGFEDGPCFLKVILTKFHVETNATNHHLRKCLMALPAKMMKLKFDIPAFNSYVQETVALLGAGGQTSTDLLVYLFDAYRKVEDKEFGDFIKRQKQDYDDGRQEFTVELLMDRALNKYNQLYQDDVWMVKSKEEEDIIALKAEIKELKSKNLSKGKSKEDKKKPGSDTNKPRKKGEQKKKDGPKYPEWRYKREGDETTKVVSGKTYHWCTKHNMWTLHEPKDCNLDKQNEAKAPGDKNKTSGPPSALRVATRALTAILEESEEDEQDQE